MKSVPRLVFGDRYADIVEMARKIGLGEEWCDGDPLKAKLDAIVSPANTIGEMSGGYDLVIRNTLGADVETRVMQSLEEAPLYLGQARALETGSYIHWIIVVPTVVAKPAGSSGNNAVGSLQSRTPGPEVIERGTYNFMIEAYRNGIERVGTVLLGGGVGGIDRQTAIRAMLTGYNCAYDAIDEMEFG